VKSPLPNKASFDMRLEFHKAFATTWRYLSEDAASQMKGTGVQLWRDAFEKFITRANARALRHLREADDTRRRGYLP
jgi:hypothetical protein